MILKYSYELFIIIFSLLSIISAIFVIISNNPLHSIISLILVFCNIVFILLIQEIEFLAMVFLIVYIGAIAVLFLFVIYMLNIKIIELNEANWQYLFGLLFSLILFIIILLIIIFVKYEYIYIFINEIDFNYINYFNYQYNLTNIKIISYFLYYNNYILFLLVSIILLVAMIGSIILTSTKTFFLKEQIIYEQNKRFIKNK